MKLFMISFALFFGALSSFNLFIALNKGFDGGLIINKAIPIPTFCHACVR